MIVGVLKEIKVKENRVCMTRNRAAKRYFGFANAVEELHANLYKNALNKMDSLEEVDYYVCAVCGYVTEGAPTDKCPVCNAPEKSFFKVD